MFTLIEHKGTIIKVRDTEGYCVCIKCRGVTPTRVEYIPTPGHFIGYRYRFTPYKCTHCNGRGYWKEDPTNHFTSSPH